MTAKTFEVNFKDIVSDLKEKGLNLCFFNKKGVFIEDARKNLYSMEASQHCFYLDKLIKDGNKIKFNLVDGQFLDEWEKKSWSVLEVEDIVKTCNFSI